MPPWVPAAIGAGASLAGGLFGRKSVKSENEKSRQWSLEQYNRQKTDNLDFWRQNNEYNSPQAQMKRLQEAGLNPAMIYGSSPSGAAGSSQQMTAPSAQTPQFKPQDFSDIPKGVSDYFDIETKQAQVDNLKSQNTVNMQTAALKQVQTLMTIMGMPQGDEIVGKEGSSMEGGTTNIYQVDKHLGFFPDATKRMFRYSQQEMIKNLAMTQAILGEQEGKAALGNLNKKLAEWNIGGNSPIGAGINLFIKSLLKTK